MSASMYEMFNYSNSSNETDSSDYGDYEFYPVVFNQPVVRNCLIFFYTLVFVPCVLGNILVIYVVAANRSMRTVTNFFLANLAVADLFVGVCVILPDLFYWISPTWFLGGVICKVYQFMKGMTTSVSISLLTVISVERYIAITLPMHSRRILTLARMRVAIVVVWLLGIGYNAPMLHLYGAVVYEDNVTVVYCMLQDSSVQTMDMIKIYANLSMCLWYFAPLLTMFVLYSLIARRLWISSGKGHMALSETPKMQQNPGGKKEKRVVRWGKEQSVPFTGKVIVSSPAGTRARTSRDLSDISGSDVSSVSSEEGNKGDKSSSKDTKHSLPYHVLFKDDNEIPEEPECDKTTSNPTLALGVAKETGGLGECYNKENLFPSGQNGEFTRTKSKTDQLQPAKSAMSLNNKYCLHVPEKIHRKSKSTSHINENGSPGTKVWFESKPSGVEQEPADATKIARRSNNKLYQRLPSKDGGEPRTTQQTSKSTPEEPIWVQRLPKGQDIKRETPKEEIKKTLNDGISDLETGKKTKYKRHIKFFSRNGIKNKYSNHPVIGVAKKKKVSTCSTSSRDSISLQTGKLRRTKSVNERVLSARKKVIRLLVAVVGSFALCLLPFQIYNVWVQVGEYPYNTMFGQLLMPLVRIIYFLNSALNPILYAFLSDNFRMKMKDALLCRRGRNAAARRNLNRPKWQIVNKFDVPSSHVSRTSMYERSDV